MNGKGTIRLSKFIQQREEEEIKHKEQALQPKHQEAEKQELLMDSFGRIAKKLRISVTDRCNMQCMYCMPQGKVQWFKEEDVLDYNEITYDR